LATKPPIFTRTSTGLIRELSAIGVFAWTVTYFPWLSSWAGIFWVTPSYYVNVDYYASLAVWAVIAIVIVVLYWQMTALMPRSGGDYVFVSRTLNPVLGFLAGFAFFVAIIVSAGSGPYWAFAESGNQLSFAGSVLGNGLMAHVGQTIVSGTTTPAAGGYAKALMYGVGLVLIALGATAVAIGGKTLRYIIYAFFGYAFITLLVVLAVFLSTSHSAFLSDYNLYASSFTNSTSGILSQAETGPLHYVPGSSLANLSAVIPLLFVSIGPYPVMQMVGGEIKNPRKSLLYGLVGAEILSIGVWFGLTYVLDRVVGISFIEAWTLASSAGNGLAPVPTIFASVIAPNPYLAWFIFGGLFVSNIGWSWLGFVFLSRVLMAWSFDGLVPAKFASVSSTFHTPTYAVALCAALGTIPMYLEFYSSFISTQVNSVFILAVVWILTSLAAILLPFRRRNIYENASGKKMKGIPFVSVIGAIGLVVFVYLAYNSVTNPAVGPFKLPAQIFLIGVFAAALAIYALSYLNNKRKNLNLAAIFAELPPD
jgi:APA family basic amino acid/polyamine antiporter